MIFGHFLYSLEVIGLRQGFAFDEKNVILNWE